RPLPAAEFAEGDIDNEGAQTKFACWRRAGQALPAGDDRSGPGAEGGDEYPADSEDAEGLGDCYAEALLGVVLLRFLGVPSGEEEERRIAYARQGLARWRRVLSWEQVERIEADLLVAIQEDLDEGSWAPFLGGVPLTLPPKQGFSTIPTRR